MQSHVVSASAHISHGSPGQQNIDLTSLAEHDVEVQLFTQRFIHLQRLFKKLDAGISQVVGADDRGVATGVATSNPLLLQYCNVAYAMIFGKIVSRRQAVSATADNHYIVTGAQWR